jgi:hypothetical protein
MSKADMKEDAILLKVNKPRNFEYKPKVYKPIEDENRPRIDFQSERRHGQSGRGSIIKMVFLVIFLVYLFISLQKAIDSAPEHAGTDNDAIIVEEIIVVD